MKWLSDEIRPVVLLYVIMFLDSIGSGIVTILNVIAVHDFNCSNFQVGMIWTGFNIAQIIGSICMGYLSDKIRRKYVLMLVLGWASIGYIFTSFTNTFTMFLISRIFTGLCGGSFSVVASILTSNISPETLPVALGRLGTVSSLGFAIGPLLSVALTAAFSISTESPFYIQRIYFYVASFIYFLACCLASRLTKNITPHQTKQEKNKCRGWLTPGLILIWASRFFSTCGVTTVYVTQVKLWGDYIDLSRIGILLTTTASGIVVSVVQGFLFPFLVKRLGCHAPLASGIALISIANLIISPLTLTDIPTLHYVCLGLFWLGIGLMEPGTPVAVSRHMATGQEMPCTRPRISIHTGLAMGTTSAMKYLASVAVPMVAGYLYDQYQTIVYYCSGGVSAVGVFTVLIAWGLYEKQLVRLSNIYDPKANGVMGLPTSDEDVTTVPSPSGII